MGKQSEPLKDLPKAWWIHQAAKAIIATTGPNHRYMMMKDGFVAFQNRVMPGFNSITASHFDANDIRAIWDILVKVSFRTERHLYPFLEAAYQQTRRQSWKAIDEPNPDYHNPDITTERVNRGTLDRANWRQGRRVS